MKKKYFGTDGIRGTFNEFPITIPFFISLTDSIKKTRKTIKKVIIGKDTRESCSLIEKAIIQGFADNNVICETCGIVSTPILSFKTRSLDYDLGVMISASHNQFTDNGIKLFNKNGEKLSDDEEIAIEKNIDLSEKNKTNGRQLLKEINLDCLDYETWLINRFVRLSNFNQSIVVDFANGSLSYIGPRFFEKLNLDFKKYSFNPTGKNINKNCGAMHPEFLTEKTHINKAKLGISFDGDADRVIFCDENGEIIDGDLILAILVMYLKKNDQLNNNMVVNTQMSNLGFREFLNEKKVNYILSQVGDRYVIEDMKKNDCVIGGEPSGHIIFSENSYCGDGLYTALLIIEILKHEDCSLAELSKKMFKKVPQKLVNLKLNNEPKLILENNEVNSYIENILSENKCDILLRKSGTENLLRLMVQANSSELVDSLIKDLVSRIKELDETK